MQPLGAEEGGRRVGTALKRLEKLKNIINAAFITNILFFYGVGRKRKGPPLTHEEAMYLELSRRADALGDLLQDARVDLMEINVDLIKMADTLPEGGELRLEELKAIEEKIGALEAKLGRA